MSLIPTCVEVIRTWDIHSVDEKLKEFLEKWPHAKVESTTIQRVDSEIVIIIFYR